MSNPVNQPQTEATYALSEPNKTRTDAVFRAAGAMRKEPAGLKRVVARRSSGRSATGRSAGSMAVAQGFGG